MDTARANAADFADVCKDLGDKAIVAALCRAEPQAQFPHGFYMTKGGCGGKPMTTPPRSQALSRSWLRPATGTARLGASCCPGWTTMGSSTKGPSRAMLAADGREVRQMLLDGCLYVSPCRKDRDALQTFLVSVSYPSTAGAVSRIGWQDGSFALPDRTIGAGAGDLVVYQSSAATDHDYRGCGTLQGWQAQVPSYAVGNSRVASALCAGFVGPLLAAVGGEGGGIHLRGPSSARRPRCWPRRA